MRAIEQPEDVSLRGPDGLPKKYRNATTEDARVLAESVKANRQVIVSGKTGTGKTYTACAALRVMAKKGITARFANVKEAVDRWYDDKGMYVYLTSPGVLCLDDLGKEATSKWAVSAIYEVVDKRYRDERLTIITTNYTIGELYELYAKCGDEKTADAIASRLRSFTAFHQGGKDRRAL
jgi:DNA replication protein DnaC